MTLFLLLYGVLLGVGSLFIKEFGVDNIFMVVCDVPSIRAFP